MESFLSDQNALLFEQFFMWLRGGHSNATLDSYNYGFSNFRKWVNKKNKDISQLSVVDLTEYAVYLENKGLRAATRQVYLGAVRTLWSWMFRQKLVSFDEKMIPVPKDRDTESYPFLEENEFIELSNSFNEFFPIELRNKCIAHVLYRTGIRLGECIAINLAEIDIEKKTIIVKTFKRHNHKREVYFDDETKRLLIKWIETRQMILQKRQENHDALFVSFNTAKKIERIYKSGIQKFFCDKRKELNWTKKISPHSCRHGFGYKAIKNGMHMRYLQQMLGHAKINTTEIYSRFKLEEIEEAYRKMMEGQN